MSLTTDQQYIANQIFKILVEGKHDEIILSGPAGTGKTYLLNYLLTDMIDKYLKTCQLLNIRPKYHFDTTIYTKKLTATTNKAVAVLRDTFNTESAMTIQSALGLVVSGDINKGTYKLKPNPHGGLNNYRDQIIVIDEASMIDKQLYSYIKQCCNDCFIIYVGDDCQLPAVREGTVPLIFNLGLPEFKLTSVIRQKDNPDLLNLSIKMRETVYSNNFKPIQLTKNIRWVTDEKEQEKILQSIQTPNDMKILTYTNQKSILYNEYIMKNHHGDGYILYPNEVYVTNSYHHINAHQAIPAESEIQVESIQGTKKFYYQEAECEFIEFTANTTVGKFYNLLTPKDPEYFQKWMKYVAKFKEWSAFFMLKEKIIDIRGTYSSTIHKAQGSTFDRIIIDADDFKKCTNPSMAARLLYVAVSRAKEEIIFFGSLPKKYGEFIL